MTKKSGFVSKDDVPKPEKELKAEWPSNVRFLLSDNQEDYAMPNCCDKGEGICGKFGCCNEDYCEICEELSHEGECEFMK
jgi:hypothetical protein